MYDMKVIENILLMMSGGYLVLAKALQYRQTLCIHLSGAWENIDYLQAKPKRWDCFHLWH